MEAQTNADHFPTDKIREGGGVYMLRRKGRVFRDTK